MFAFVDRKIEKITPKRATELLDINTLEAQRPIRGPHLDDLVKKHNDGLFRTGLIAVAENGDGHRYLMNGQHQCRMVLACNKHIEATVEYYKTHTPEDLSLLYRQFDVPGTTRSVQDITRVEAAALKLDWGKKTISLMVAAIGIVEKGTIQHKVTGADRVDLLSDYMKEGAFVDGVLRSEGKASSDFSGHLKNRSVVACMILSFRKSQKDADKFWQDVRDGEDLSRTDPAHTLRNWLMTHTQQTRSPGMASRRVSAEEVLARCIAAWNAFRKGGQTALKIYKNKAQKVV